MVSHLFFYQLALSALVWLYLMLQWAWPSAPTLSPTEVDCNRNGSGLQSAHCQAKTCTMRSTAACLPWQIVPWVSRKYPWHDV